MGGVSGFGSDSKFSMGDNFASDSRVENSEVRFCLWRVTSALEGIESTLVILYWLLLFAVCVLIYLHFERGAK
jgi:hypothetical protein